MQVYVNGDPHTIPDESSLADVLEEVSAPREGIAVEVNRAIVRRADFPTRRLAAEDRIEIVGLVGGG